MDIARKPRFFLFVLFGCVMAFIVACSGKGASLGVTKGNVVQYRDSTGDRVRATYYSLTDNSLHFVRLEFSNATTYTLPQIVSASGARFSDERDLVWWIKGNMAFTETRDINGNWIKGIEYWENSKRVNK
jgi:membrane-bound inhibitor of C-type lysozyme